MGRIVVGVSGASGIILAHKTCIAIAQAGHSVDLVISKSALMTAHIEMGPLFGTTKGFLASFSDQVRESITLHSCTNFGATIASGSFSTLGMIIVPCSMATLASVALGLSDNLLRRAADVTLKERRTLILVPREAPLSAIHLEHMLSLTRMGAIIVPPVPAWYTLPKTLDDVENFIVGKVLDALRIEHALYPRWTG